MKRRLAKYGRGPDDLKIMSGVTVALGDTEAEAHEQAEEIRRQQVSPRTAPLTRGAPQFLVGTPGEAAAELVESAARDAADGFVLVPHPTQGGLDEFVDRVVPLLQERGAFRTAYEGTTLRSHLGLADPVRKD